MTDSYAFSLIATGGATIAFGAVVQALLASWQAAGRKDPLSGWPRVFGWGAVMTGAIMNAVGAGHFAGW